MAIQAVPSDCSSTPSTGSLERSKGPMLSKPRKPPSNRLSPSTSLRLTHQLKLSSNLCRTRARKSQSSSPAISYTRRAAQAWTGGLTSEKFHSYTGSWPLGWTYHSRQSRMSWDLANSGSTCASATQWKARSQAAYHGYSHLSGIEMTSLLFRCFHALLRPASRVADG